MKLTTFILIASLMQVSAAGYAQKISLNEKDASLKGVLLKLRSQTGYDFIYDAKVIGDRKVTVEIKNADLNEVLRKILTEQHLDYVIERKFVVIKPKKPSFLDGFVSAFSNIDVHGHVIDEKGAPMAGAFMRIENGSATYATGKDGVFHFRNLPETSRIIISYVGYQTDTVPVLGKTDLLIIMKPQVNTIDEVNIVSNGYQNIPKERATGSFGVVTAKEMEKYPVVSVLERLQGLVPGVNISTKTVAGKSRNGSVTIRGLSTIVSSYSQVSTDPLLVIDGFPSSQPISNGAFDFLNPDDIEQVTFLKDAAAASIWGIQASNGVIVITTKKGRRNAKPSVSFSTTFGTSKVPAVNYGPIMSMPEYIELEKDLINKGRLIDPRTRSSGSSSENNSQGQAIVWSFKRGEITESEMNRQLTELSKFDNQGQMADYLLQSPTTNQYNLSVSGGSANNSYFMSGYMYDEDRVYKSNKNKGFSMNMGGTTSLFNGRVNINSNLSIGNTNDKINGAAVRAMGINSGGIRPYNMLKNEDGSNIYYDVLTVPSVARNLESKGYLPFGYSPIDELDYSNTRNNSNNVGMNLAINGKITSWLSANVSGNLARTFGESETYWEPGSYEARILINKATSVNTGPIVYGIPNGGRLELNNSLSRSYNLRGQLAVDKNWNNKHQLNLLFGNEIREAFNKGSGELRYGYDKSISTFVTVNPSVGFRDMYGSTQTVGATSKPVTEKTTRSLSYYANGSYTFLGKYTASASARFDDLNLLGVERRKRAIPLWSTGLKWDVKKESFFNNITWLDQLSARATLGFTGNAPQGYAPVTVVNQLGTEFYSGLPYANIATPARDNLAWEKTRMYNYGIDFSILNNRLSGSLEYYEKHSTDIFFQLPINSTYGFSSTIFNTAKLDGRGVDMGLNIVPVLGKNFQWTSTLNASYNTNVVHDERFKNPVGSLSNNFIYDGYPSDYLFSYIWAGLDSKGESLIEDPNIPGKIYNSLDNPFYDSREYSGRTTSPWFGSFNNSFNYKEFSLSFQLQFVFGGVFRKPSISSLSNYISRSADFALRWRKPGDELTTNVPGFEIGENTNYFASLPRYQESNYLIRSRSNIKLQQIMLSYALPKPLLRQLGVNSVTLSAVVRNLGMIWSANKEGIDPDYLYTTGNTYQLAPVPAYSFRMALNF